MVASKGTNRNSGNARFSSMSSMSSKNLSWRKQIFAAHREDKAKDVLICEGEQTRNRGSYTFYSPKNLPKLFASVGGTLRSATREELKAWLQKMNLEGSVVENEEDQSRCVRKQQQNKSNSGYHYHQQLECLRENAEGESGYSSSRDIFKFGVFVRRVYGKRISREKDGGEAFETAKRDRKRSRRRSQKTKTTAIEKETKDKT